MTTAIAIRCLRCGHTASIAEDHLPDYGFKPDAPIALLSRRFKCRECGSRATEARRYDCAKAA